MTAKRIDFTESVHYTLSIRLSTDGFSFSIWHSRSKEVCGGGTYAVNVRRSLAANVKAFLAETEEMGHAYGQVDILVHTPRFTSVPLELFEDEQMEAVFYQNLPQRNNEIVLCNVLGRGNPVLLFSMDKLTHLYLSEHFPKARFLAAIGAPMEYLASKHRAEDRARLVALLHEGSMDVLAFREGRLLLANSFGCTQAEDRLYYLLNLWKQLAFSQQRDTLCLVGTDEAPSLLVETLKKYIRQVETINPRTDVLQPETSMPFEMQALLICE